MYVVTWTDPASYEARYHYLVDGWFLFTLDRREIIETTRPEQLTLEKLMPMVGLAMPIHDLPREHPSPLQKMLAKVREVDQKRY